jgi:SPP1 family predicted phage head-tail adaptor
MQAGKLNKRVRLQRPARTQDEDTGGMIDGWEEVRTQFASIEPLSANAFIAAQAVQSKVSTRIVLRYRDDITASWRVLHKGRTYNIEGVLPDPDSGTEYITLPCSQGVNNG